MNKLMYMVMVAFAFLISATGICKSAERSNLADKLATGSPWQFTTKYENTKMEFRYNPDGVFEKWRPKKNSWVHQKIAEGDKVVIKTIENHLITLELGKDGYPRATHSKHESTFRSLKNESQ